MAPASGYLARLEETGHLAEALAAQDVADAVAIHKNAFFAEKDANGNRIDHLEAVQVGLTLLHSGARAYFLKQNLTDLADLIFSTGMKIARTFC